MKNHLFVVLVLLKSDSCSSFVQLSEAARKETPRRILNSMTLRYCSLLKRRRVVVYGRDNKSALEKLLWSPRPLGAVKTYHY